MINSQSTWPGQTLFYFHNVYVKIYEERYFDVPFVHVHTVLIYTCLYTHMRRYVAINHLLMSPLLI